MRLNLFLDFVYLTSSIGPTSFTYFITQNGIVNFLSPFCHLDLSKYWVRLKTNECRKAQVKCVQILATKIITPPHLILNFIYSVTIYVLAKFIWLRAQAIKQKKKIKINKFYHFWCDVKASSLTSRDGGQRITIC